MAIKIAIPLVVVLLVLTQFRKIKSLQYFYSCGVLFTACIILMILVVSIIRIADNGPADTSAFIVSGRSFNVIGKSGLIVGTALFAFDFSPVILNIAINMKKPRQFPAVVYASYIIACVGMASTAFIAYIAFGAH